MAEAAEHGDLPKKDIGRVSPAVHHGAIILLLLMLSVALVAGVESLAGRPLHRIPQFLSSMPGLTTVSGIFMIALGLDVLMGRAFRSMLLIAPAALALAFLSGEKQQYLSDPLYPSDLLFARQIKELLPVMASAQPLMAVTLGLVTVLVLALVVYCGFFAWNRFPKLSSRARLFRLVFSLPFLVGFTPMMEYTDHSWLRDRLKIRPMMWDQAANYRHNGFLVAFAFNAPMSKVSAPKGYDAAAIAQVEVDRDVIPASPVAGRSQPADVIVVMSESLWDPTRMPGVEFMADPMPTIRQNQAGNVFSPEFGGMTANVEFEALTGFSNAFLPYGSIPYQQYIRRPLPSLARFFRDKGYEAVALHPFEGWFWNRENVYRHLGFDRFLAQDALPELEKRGRFASDEALIDQIMRIGDESVGPLFLFAVTLQGHGPYEATRYPSENVELASTLSAAATQQVGTFAEGVREADSSLTRLMEWAKTRPRETIIVLFGDHLPPLGKAFVESGYMQDAVAARRAPLPVMLKEHETPLIVWSSKTGPRKDLGTISPALLPHQIVTSAGLSDPFYTGFLGKIAAHYSVIDRYMLVDAEGSAHPGWQDGRKAAPPPLQEYRLLQHDMIFGDQFSRERFFPGLQGEEAETGEPVAALPQSPRLPG
ncbi:LTA synthase family protein [Pseudorhizobium flavum]|uniref:LTA synthase family protein n=1 Tax=Pseudorhizobium flavum TaxID=1335061 RepID=UPI00376F85C2